MILFFYSIFWIEIVQRAIKKHWITSKQLNENANNAKSEKRDMLRGRVLANTYILKVKI